MRITSRDDHIGKYGALFAGMSRSQWKTCSDCGFVHQNPRPSVEALQEFYLHAKYHDRPESPDPKSYVSFAYWYYKEKVDYALTKSGLTRGRVFEIGCGLGGALKVFSDYGWDCYGVEPDAFLAEFARAELGLTGVRTGLLDAAFQLPDKVDLIFSNHAFEHVADLDDLMRGVCNILRPGGFIFTAIPTYYSNRSRLSKLWMNSAHYSLFTARSLEQLFARHGIQEVEHTYRGWRKEIDDLWHLGHYTGASLDAGAFFEEPRAVQRYVNVINPIRSALYFPFYSAHAQRIQLRGRAKHLILSAMRAPRWLGRRLLSRLGRPRIEGTGERSRGRR